MLADLQIKGCDDMDRPSPSRDQHRVGAQIESISPGLGCQPVRGDTREETVLARADRLGSGREAVARLHLDENDSAPTPDDQIDLAALAAVAARERPVALEHEICERDRLGM